MRIQQNFSNYQNQPNFSAMAIRKPIKGQDAHQTSQEIAKTLGIDPTTFHTPYGTIDGVLLKFKSPEAEEIAKKAAQMQNIKFNLLADENINKRNAKAVIRTVGE